MLKVQTYLKEIQGKGIGLFANQFIPKGTIVFHFEFPDVITGDLASKGLPELSKKFIDFYGYQEKDMVLIYVDNARFMNHSSEPNCDYKERTCYANRDINQGEELSCNYFEACDWVKENGLGFDEK